MDKIVSKTAQLDLDEGENEEGEDGNFEMIDMPAEIARRVIGLKKLQEQAEALDADYKKERIQLEAKYRRLKQPFYNQRQQIVVGAVEPTFTPEEESHIPEASTEEGAAPVRGIPGFWSQCLTNSSLIGDFVTDDDLPALNHLIDIQCAYNEEMSSFTISFHFEENPYFTDKVLSKTYNLNPDLLDEQAPSLSGIVGCEINWKAGQNLCVGTVQKKQKGKSGKRKGQVRFVTREEPKPSFFHYFGQPEEDMDEEEEEPEEMPEHIKFTVEEDYEVGHTLRTDIIPKAVLWYTGEAIEDDDDEDYDYEGEDEDDEDDDDDEDDEPVAKPVRGPPKGPPRGPAPAGGAGQVSGEQAPECKQN